jgi:hypothetical protein
MAAHGLRRRPAVHPLGALVPVLDAAVHVPDQDGVIGPVEQGRLVPDAPVGPPLELLVQEARLQQVLDPQQHLDGVERLGQEVLGPRGQGAPLGLGRHVGRQHHHRQVGPLRQGPQLRHHRHAVQVGHHQVQQDQVRLKLHVHGDGLARVGQAPPAGVAALPQDALQEPEVSVLVVHDQDLGVAVGGLGDHSAVPPCSTAPTTPRNRGTSIGLVR